MKKIYFTILSLILSASLGIAQSSTSAFNKGDDLLNLGIGIGTQFFGSGYSASLPINPTLSYEKGILDAISVGGQLSYASSKYSYSNPGYNYSLTTTAIYVGARGSYHLSSVIDIPSNIDLYGGASLGYVIVNVSDNTGNGVGVGSGLGLGFFVGGKYYFSGKTAIYTELGYQSLSYLNVGLAFKF